MASFVCLEKQPQSALKMLNMQTMCSSIFRGKQQGLTVYYELEWSALFLFLITTLTGDVASGMKWRRLREFLPSPQAFITFSSLYKWRIWNHNLPQRGRWFLTLASSRVWGLRIYFVKKVSCKNHSLRIDGGRADLHKSCDHPPWSICGFGVCVQVAGLPESATFNNLTLTQILNPPLGKGEDGLGSHIVPPPHLGILFCLILLSYLTSWMFSGCKFSLLKHHGFLISTQLSWDGYLLLYSPKSSIRGTTSYLHELKIRSFRPWLWQTLLL